MSFSFAFSLSVLLASFLVILAVELPDKTLVATLVLSTKYRPLPVFLGVTLAFLVQCVVAVTAGSLLQLLPHRLLLVVVALLFATGAFILLREAYNTSPPTEIDDDDEPPVGPEVSTRRMVTTTFGVLFAAEWGDASQLATAALTARYGQPVTVFIGSFVALVGVAALAIVLGQVILRVVPLVWVHRIAGAVFALFAVLVASQAIRG
ncbi:MAG: TMEM165/GDT1 family protein [Actinomycetota bacterium]|nr:TMEM165/GDT1 family protein [Actinomycetota bacterium]